MRLNATDMSGVDLSTIPVDSIERVEVYHGGNSVLFGDRAIGGVINIITKNLQRVALMQSQILVHIIMKIITQMEFMLMKIFH